MKSSLESWVRYPWPAGSLSLSHSCLRIICPNRQTAFRWHSYLFGWSYFPSTFLPDSYCILSCESYSRSNELLFHDSVSHRNRYMLTREFFLRFIGDLANLIGATLARLVPTVIVWLFQCCFHSIKRKICWVIRYGCNTCFSSSIPFSNRPYN